MTKTTKLPTTCIECATKLTSKNRSSSPSNNSDTVTDRNDVCTKCYDYWGWENTHTDEAHNELNVDPECPVCVKEFHDLATDAGWTQDTGRKNRSHADCDHVRTPAARAKCRKANA